MTLLSIEKALATILDNVTEVDSEFVDLSNACGRILSQDIKSLRTQPPFDVSSMDGYAIRAADVSDPSLPLKVVGEVPAGYRFEGVVAKREAVRIFTGAPMPDGTDSVLIQENVKSSGNEISALTPVSKGQFVRKKGLDFVEGKTLLKKARKLNFRDISLAAAMNHPTLPVYRKPKVGILSTGDELVLPGCSPSPNQIVASNNFGLCGYIEQQGGVPVDLGIAVDQSEDIFKKVAKAQELELDVLVTLGGASVGDHDLVKSVLGYKGMDLKFWRIAMRPGKPLMFGNLSDLHVLGLPGNPVSALVCSIVFLRPLILGMLAQDTNLETDSAISTLDLPENDERQDYLRAVSAMDENGMESVSAFAKQDSSMLAQMSEANCLIVRPPFANCIKAGDQVQIIRI